MSYYEQASQFAALHIQPTSAECDAEAKFPEVAFKQMAKEGWFSMMIPTAMGGQGQGLDAHAEVCMAFAEANPSAGLCYMMHNVALMCVLTYGSDELKQQICSDVLNDGKFLALAYSELGSGTHFYNPQIHAKFASEHVILDGLKSMVTSAGQASWYLVLAPSAENGKVDNWAVPLSAAGLSFDNNTWQGMGMRPNISCPMKLDNVQISMSNRLGVAGSGAEQVFSVVAPFFVTGLAAVYSGVCLSLSHAANEHAKSRKYPDAQPLSHIETVQTHLANIYTRAIAAKSLTLAAANATSDVLQKILAARIFASESAIECGRLAMRVGGGKAYNKALTIERFLRDAYAGQVMAPGVDVLNIWLGKTLTDQPIP